jgi:competence protein ComEC
LIQNNIIQPTALMANLWVSWMSSILLFLGLGVLCLAPLWPWLASGLGIITSFLLKVMVHVTQPFYSSPIPVPYPLNYWLSIVIFLIPVMIFYPKSCRKVMILMGIIGGIIVACLFQRTLVVAIDVGQGDATLIVDGFKSVLIDTGGRYRGKSMAQTHILPVLNYYGIRTLDAMILTHHDLDHIGGVADVYRRGVVNTYSSKPLNLSNMIVVDAPQRLGLPRGWLDITPMAPIMSAFSSNNQSVLVSVYLKGYSFLITGDIDETAELAFIQAHHPSVHTVYKLGHHGSQSSTSSELLNTLQPTMAWNSAGRDNRYGHPHTSVISRLNDRGIPWLATDTHGAIYFKIQATTLTVSSELGHERWVIPSNL